MGYYSALKEWNSEACYNMGGPWKHYAEWISSDIEGQLLPDST